MKFVLYTTSVSAHQLPLAREIIRRVGADNFRFVHTGESQGGAQDVVVHEPWIVHVTVASEILESAEFLLCDVRDIDLIERRVFKGLRTYYTSERWFKPIPLISTAAKDVPWLRGLKGLYLPGWVRMLVPNYRRRALRFRRLLQDNSLKGVFEYLPVSMNSAHDMEQLLRLSPWINVRRGEYAVGDQVAERMHLWGYFVAPSCKSKDELEQLRQRQVAEVRDGVRPLRILWVGRMMALKNIDVILRAFKVAVQSGLNGELTLVGKGTERMRMEQLAEKLGLQDIVKFSPPVSLDGVRELMRAHDLYVFASNGFDGWGAVVSEALEEHMTVIASQDCGAGASALPCECTFPCRNVRALARLMTSFDSLPRRDARNWSAYAAANWLLERVP